MGIRQDLATLKTLASQGGELLLLRLRVLQMDANEQLRGVLVIAALIVLAAVVLVVQQTLAALQQDLAAFSGSLKTAGFRQKPQTGEARDAE